MNEYLLLTLEDESAHAAEAPKKIAELIEKKARFARDLKGEKKLVDAARLRPSKEGMRARRSGGSLVTTKGPFAEDGKTIGECHWVKAKSLDEATAIAMRCPMIMSDEIDVRPIMSGLVEEDKETKPGKIFAFAVLGSSPNEKAWVKVMDAIDRETQDGFPDSFLGGVRLEAPSAGHRIATRDGKRATFDGPFLESKEVIGGICFVRFSTLDEAVRWAADTPFVVHGTLEIRELWRS